MADSKENYRLDLGSERVNVPSKPLMINYLSDDRFYTVGKFQDREVYITYHILKCVSYTSIIYDKL